MGMGMGMGMDEGTSDSDVAVSAAPKARPDPKVEEEADPKAEASAPASRLGVPEYWEAFERSLAPELSAAGRETFHASELQDWLSKDLGLTPGQVSERNKKGFRHANLCAHCLKRAMARNLIRRMPEKGKDKLYGLVSAAGAGRRTRSGPKPTGIPSEPPPALSLLQASGPAGFSAEDAADCVLDVLDIPEGDALHAVSAAMGGRPLLLSGPPSGGKTTLARLLPKAMEAGGAGAVAFRSDSMDATYTKYGLIGGVDGNGNWRDGSLAAAIRACPKDGRMVYLADEFGRFPQGSNLGSALTMLADPVGSRRLVLTGHPDGEVLDVPPGFVFVATRNPSDGEAAFRMEPSVRSRFEEIGMVPPPPEKGRLGAGEWEAHKRVALDSLFGGCASAAAKSRAEAAIDGAEDFVRKVLGGLRAAAPGWTGHRRVAAVCHRVAARALAKGAPPAGALAMDALMSEIVGSADAADFGSDPGLLDRLRALKDEVPEGKDLFEALVGRGISSGLLV